MVLRYLRNLYMFLPHIPSNTTVTLALLCARTLRQYNFPTQQVDDGWEMSLDISQRVQYKSGVVINAY